MSKSMTSPKAQQPIYRLAPPMELALIESKNEILLRY